MARPAKQRVAILCPHRVEIGVAETRAPALPELMSPADLDTRSPCRAGVAEFGDGVVEDDQVIEIISKVRHGETSTARAAIESDLPTPALLRVERIVSEKRKVELSDRRGAECFA